MNKEGAVAGMVAGLLFTGIYIVYFKFWFPEQNLSENWWFGISPEGIGTLGMMINITVSMIISRFYSPPPEDVKTMVENIRYPR